MDFIREINPDLIYLGPEPLISSEPADFTDIFRSELDVVAFQPRRFVDQDNLGVDRDRDMRKPEPVGGLEVQREQERRDTKELQHFGSLKSVMFKQRLRLFNPGAEVNIWVWLSLCKQIWGIFGLEIAYFADMIR